MITHEKIMTKCIGLLVYSYYRGSRREIFESIASAGRSRLQQDTGNCRKHVCVGRSRSVRFSHLERAPEFLEFGAV